MQSPSTQKDLKVSKLLHSMGYVQPQKITDTLQGSIWRALQHSTNGNRSVVIKATDRYLHNNQMTLIDQRKIRVCENIKKEAAILKELSEDTQCPKSIVRYLGAFKSNRNYFVLMEDGGVSLFDFVIKAHRFIDAGHLDIVEWHKMVKLIFKQMIESIEYIHSKKVCHFDISLENFVINDVEIAVDTADNIRFVTNAPDSVQIKLCDFGLADVFSDANPDFQSDKYCGKPIYQSPEISERKKTFSAASNDVWCLGTCLFMMIVGSAPWKRAVSSDIRFKQMMNGDIAALLTHWNKSHFVNPAILHCFVSFFQFEANRVTIDELKQSRWLLASD